jgi:hypothetical protein
LATLAVFICPERIGISRVKTAGAKPCYATPIWNPVEDVQKLLTEPALLASLIREMAGEEEKFQVYMNIWPGAFKAVMFSHDKRNKKDVKRLRRSELEVVFHGDLTDQYSYDLLMDKGRPSFGNKSRRIIYTFPRGQLKLMVAAFKERKMKIQRIVPMDAAVCEAALRYWAPKKRTINACIVLDEGCTSIALLRRGAIQAMRTIPNGCSSVLSSYMQITGEGIDACLDMIRQNGVNASEDNEMPTIQDNMMRTINKLAGEVVKMLHTTFGENAVLDKVLLCGNFVDTVDLIPYMSTMLGTECIAADAATLKPGASAAIALNLEDLTRLFPFATNDRNRLKRPHALADSLEKCRPLGAVGGGKGGVLNITARKHAPVGGQKCRAHQEARIGGVSAFSCFNRRFDQFQVAHVTPLPSRHSKSSHPRSVSPARQGTRAPLRQCRQSFPSCRGQRPHARRHPRSASAYIRANGRWRGWTDRTHGRR